MEKREGFMRIYHSPMWGWTCYDESTRVATSFKTREEAVRFMLDCGPRPFDGLDASETF